MSAFGITMASGSYWDAGATHTAASASLADVTTAMGLCSDGDTLAIPADSKTWTTTGDGVAVLVVTKGIRIKGAGKTLTHITASGTTSLDYLIRVSPGSDKKVAVEGIEFIFTTQTQANPGGRAVYVLGSLAGAYGLTQVRIHDCKFTRGTRAVCLEGWVEALVDNNEFYNNNIAVGTIGDGWRAWTRSFLAGSVHSNYIEHNTFTLDGNVAWDINEAIYAQDGSRYVARYNTVDVTACTAATNWFFATGHPNDGYYDPASPGSHAHADVVREVYRNVVHFYQVNVSCINSRGGCLIAHDETYTTVTGSPYFCQLTEEEDWQTILFNPLRTVWPAQEQVANTFFWSNTLNGVAVGVSKIQTNAQANDSTFIQEDRDFFMHAPQATGGRTVYSGSRNGGSTGVPTDGGSGLPADNGDTSFNAGLSNLFYPYSEYDYPHPLQAVL
jgi:hypothetical protein